MASKKQVTVTDISNKPGAQWVERLKKQKSMRGFASMSLELRRRIASMGGKASGGNFKHDKKRASLSGKLGAAKQSLEAKILGGRNSWKNRKRNG